MILLMPSSHSPLCLEDRLSVSTHLTSILLSDWPVCYTMQSWTALSVVHKHVFVRRTNHLNRMNDWRRCLGGAPPPPLGVRLGAWENSAGMRNPGQSQGPDARRLLKHISQAISGPFPSPPSGFAGWWRGTCAKAVVCRSHKNWCVLRLHLVISKGQWCWNPLPTPETGRDFWGTGELVKGIATISR